MTALQDDLHNYALLLRTLFAPSDRHTTPVADDLLDESVAVEGFDIVNVLLRRLHGQAHAIHQLYAVEDARTRGMFAEGQTYLGPHGLLNLQRREEHCGGPQTTASRPPLHDRSCCGVATDVHFYLANDDYASLLDAFVATLIGLKALFAEPSTAARHTSPVVLRVLTGLVGFAHTVVTMNPSLACWACLEAPNRAGGPAPPMSLVWSLPATVREMYVTARRHVRSKSSDADDGEAEMWSDHAHELAIEMVEMCVMQAAGTTSELHAIVGDTCCKALLQSLLASHPSGDSSDDAVAAQWLAQSHTAAFELASRTAHYLLDVASSFDKADCKPATWRWLASIAIAFTCTLAGDGGATGDSDSPPLLWTRLQTVIRVEAAPRGVRRCLQGLHHLCACLALVGGFDAQGILQFERQARATATLHSFRTYTVADWTYRACDGALVLPEKFFHIHAADATSQKVVDDLVHSVMAGLAAVALAARQPRKPVHTKGEQFIIVRREDQFSHDQLFLTCASLCSTVFRASDLRATQRLAFLYSTLLRLVSDLCVAGIILASQAHQQSVPSDAPREATRSLLERLTEFDSPQKHNTGATLTREARHVLRQPTGVTMPPESRVAWPFPTLAQLSEPNIVSNGWVEEDMALFVATPVLGHALAYLAFGTLTAICHQCLENQVAAMDAIKNLCFAPLVARAVARGMIPTIARQLTTASHSAPAHAVFLGFCRDVLTHAVAPVGVLPVDLGCELVDVIQDQVLFRTVIGKKPVEWTKAADVVGALLAVATMNIYSHGATPQLPAAALLTPRTVDLLAAAAASAQALTSRLANATPPPSVQAATQKLFAEAAGYCLVEALDRTQALGSVTRESVLAAIAAVFALESLTQLEIPKVDAASCLTKLPFVVEKIATAATCVIQCLDASHEVGPNVESCAEAALDDQRQIDALFMFGRKTGPSPSLPTRYGLLVDHLGGQTASPATLARLLFSVLCDALTLALRLVTKLAVGMPADTVSFEWIYPSLLLGPMIRSRLFTAVVARGLVGWSVFQSRWACAVVAAHCVLDTFKAPLLLDKQHSPSGLTEQAADDGPSAPPLPFPGIVNDLVDLPANRLVTEGDCGPSSAPSYVTLRDTAVVPPPQIISAAPLRILCQLVEHGWHRTVAALEARDHRQRDAYFTVFRDAIIFMTSELTCLRLAGNIATGVAERSAGGPDGHLGISALEVLVHDCGVLTSSLEVVAALHCDRGAPEANAGAIELVARLIVAARHTAPLTTADTALLLKLIALPATSSSVMTRSLTLIKGIPEYVSRPAGLHTITPATGLAGLASTTTDSAAGILTDALFSVLNATWHFSLPLRSWTLAGLDTLFDRSKGVDVPKVFPSAGLPMSPISLRGGGKALTATFWFMAEARGGAGARHHLATLKFGVEQRPVSIWGTVEVATPFASHVSSDRMYGGRGSSSSQSSQSANDPTMKWSSEMGELVVSNLRAGRWYCLCVPVVSRVSLDDSKTAPKCLRPSLFWFADDTTHLWRTGSAHEREPFSSVDIISSASGDAMVEIERKLLPVLKAISLGGQAAARDATAAFALPDASPQSDGGAVVVAPVAVAGKIPRETVVDMKHPGRKRFDGCKWLCSSHAGKMGAATTWLGTFMIFLGTPVDIQEPRSWFLMGSDACASSAFLLVDQRKAMMQDRFHHLWKSASTSSAGPTPLVGRMQEARSDMVQKHVQTSTLLSDVALRVTPPSRSGTSSQAASHSTGERFTTTASGPSGMPSVQWRDLKGLWMQYSLEHINLPPRPSHQKNEAEDVAHQKDEADNSILGRHILRSVTATLEALGGSEFLYSLAAEKHRQESGLSHDATRLPHTPPSQRLVNFATHALLAARPCRYCPTVCLPLPSDEVGGRDDLECADGDVVQAAMRCLMSLMATRRLPPSHDSATSLFIALAHSPSRRRPILDALLEFSVWSREPAVLLNVLSTWVSVLIPQTASVPSLAWMIDGPVRGMLSEAGASAAALMRGKESTVCLSVMPFWSPFPAFRGTRLPGYGLAKLLSAMTCWDRWPSDPASEANVAVSGTGQGPLDKESKIATALRWLTWSCKASRPAKPGKDQLFKLEDNLLCIVDCAYAFMVRDRKYDHAVSATHAATSAAVDEAFLLLARGRAQAHSWRLAALLLFMSVDGEIKAPADGHTGGRPEREALKQSVASLLSVPTWRNPVEATIAAKCHATCEHMAAIHQELRDRRKALYEYLWNAVRVHCIPKAPSRTREGGHARHPPRTTAPAVPDSGPDDNAIAYGIAYDAVTPIISSLSLRATDYGEDRRDDPPEKWSLVDADEWADIVNHVDARSHLCIVRLASMTSSEQCNVLAESILSSLVTPQRAATARAHATAPQLQLADWSAACYEALMQAVGPKATDPALKHPPSWQYRAHVLQFWASVYMANRFEMHQLSTSGHFEDHIKELDKLLEKSCRWLDNTALRSVIVAAAEKACRVITSCWATCCQAASSDALRTFITHVVDVWLYAPSPNAPTDPTRVGLTAVGSSAEEVDPVVATPAPRLYGQLCVYAECHDASTPAVSVDPGASPTGRRLLTIDDEWIRCMKEIDRVDSATALLPLTVLELCMIFAGRDDTPATQDAYWEWRSLHWELASRLLVVHSARGPAHVRESVQSTQSTFDGRTVGRLLAHCWAFTAFASQDAAMTDVDWLYQSRNRFNRRETCDLEWGRLTSDPQKRMWPESGPERYVLCRTNPIMHLSTGGTPGQRARDMPQKANWLALDRFLVAVVAASFTLGNSRRESHRLAPLAAVAPDWSDCADFVLVAALMLVAASNDTTAASKRPPAPTGASRVSDSQSFFNLSFGDLSESVLTSRIVDLATRFASAAFVTVEGNEATDDSLIGQLRRLHEAHGGGHGGGAASPHALRQRSAGDSEDASFRNDSAASATQVGPEGQQTIHASGGVGSVPTVLFTHPSTHLEVLTRFSYAVLNIVASQRHALHPLWGSLATLYGGDRASAMPSDPELLERHNGGVPTARPSSYVTGAWPAASGRPTRMVLFAADGVDALTSPLLAAMPSIGQTNPLESLAERLRHAGHWRVWLINKDQMAMAPDAPPVVAEVSFTASTYFTVPLPRPQMLCVNFFDVAMSVVCHTHKGGRPSLQLISVLGCGWILMDSITTPPAPAAAPPLAVEVAAHAYELFHLRLDSQMRLTLPAAAASASPDPPRDSKVHVDSIPSPMPLISNRLKQQLSIGSPLPSLTGGLAAGSGGDGVGWVWVDATDSLNRAAIGGCLRTPMFAEHWLNQPSRQLVTVARLISPHRMGVGMESGLVLVIEQFDRAPRRDLRFYGHTSPVIGIAASELTVTSMETELRCLAAVAVDGRVIMWDGHRRIVVRSIDTNSPRFRNQFTVVLDAIERPTKDSGSAGGAAAVDASPTSRAASAEGSSRRSLAFTIAPSSLIAVNPIHQTLLLGIDVSLGEERRGTYLTVLAPALGDDKLVTSVVRVLWPYGCAASTGLHWLLATPDELHVCSLCLNPTKVTRLKPAAPLSERGAASSGQIVDLTVIRTGGTLSEERLQIIATAMSDLSSVPCLLRLESWSKQSSLEI